MPFRRLAGGDTARATRCEAPARSDERASGVVPRDGMSPTRRSCCSRCSRSGRATRGNAAHLKRVGDARGRKNRLATVAPSAPSRELVHASRRAGGSARSASRTTLFPGVMDLTGARAPARLARNHQWNGRTLVRHVSISAYGVPYLLCRGEKRGLTNASESRPRRARAWRAIALVSGDAEFAPALRGATASRCAALGLGLDAALRVVLPGVHHELTAHQPRGAPPMPTSHIAACRLVRTIPHTQWQASGAPRCRRPTAAIRRRPVSRRRRANEGGARSARRHSRSARNTLADLLRRPIR